MSNESNVYHIPENPNSVPGVFNSLMAAANLSCNGLVRTEADEYVVERAIRAFCEQEGYSAIHFSCAGCGDRHIFITSFDLTDDELHVAASTAMHLTTIGVRTERSFDTVDEAIHQFDERDIEKRHSSE